MHRSKLKALAAMACLTAASWLVADPNQATAEYLDALWSIQNLPSNPLVDPDGTVTWGDDWILLPRDETGKLNYQTEIPANGSLFLGLENRYVEDQTKTVTLELIASNSVAPAQGKKGFPNTIDPPFSWQMTTNDLGEHRTYTGTITPQPSWEWIEIKNSNSIPMSLTIVDFTSTCTPEPATSALLVIALAAMLFWYRKKMTKA